MVSDCYIWNRRWMILSGLAYYLNSEMTKPLTAAAISQYNQYSWMTDQVQTIGTNSGNGCEKKLHSARKLASL